MRRRLLWTVRTVALSCVRPCIDRLLKDLGSACKQGGHVVPLQTIAAGSAPAAQTTAGGAWEAQTNAWSTSAQTATESTFAAQTADWDTSAAQTATGSASSGASTASTTSPQETTVVQAGFSSSTDNGAQAPFSLSWMTVFGGAGIIFALQIVDYC